MKSLPNNALSHQSTPQNPNLAQDSLDLQGVLLADVSDSVQSPPAPRSNAEQSATSSTSLSDKIPTFQLDAVNINSVGDEISESGISEGILNKGVAIGPLDNKRVMDVPFQINTITRELLDNQSVQSSDEVIKYFPSVQLQYRGGAEMGPPQTRGIGGEGIGYMFWDGFYVVTATSIPMIMFESLQVQNGLAGALYGNTLPAGTFVYSRKRPKKDYNAVWFDFISRGNLGVGLDTSDKFQYVGYRAVLFSSNGEREPANNEFQRQLAYFALDFYPLENLIFETNFSHYRNIASGNRYGSVSVTNTNGIARNMPTFADIKDAGSEQFMETTVASGKVKFAPSPAWYLEGGYQWQRAIRNRNSNSRPFGFFIPSAFLKAQFEAQTGVVSHNVALSANGYQFRYYHNNAMMYYTRNIGFLYDIGITRYFDMVFSVGNSWFKEPDYKNNGLSFAGSAIVKIVPDKFNVYFTYADSLQAGSSHTYGLDTNGELSASCTQSWCGETVTTKPYRSRMYEFGAKAKLGEFDLSFALYQITRPTYYEVTDASGTPNFGKQGEQRNRGVEFTAGGNIIEYLSVFGGVSLLDAKIAESYYENAVGKKVPGEPLWQANVLFDFAVPYTNKLAFTANLHYTDKRYVDDMNTKAVDGYFTADLGVRYATTKWLGKETTIRLNVNNLFNEKYWVGMFPNSGTLDGTLGSTSTSLFRSYDRTFVLSGQVKF